MDIYCINCKKIQNSGHAAIAILELATMHCYLGLITYGSSELDFTIFLKEKTDNFAFTRFLIVKGFQSSLYLYNIFQCRSCCFLPLHTETGMEL